MTEKEMKFCELYAAEPNATNAAIGAGYSERSAHTLGNRLLQKVEIKKYLSELTEPAHSQRVADAVEIQETWTRILRDEKARHRDRLEAGKLLFAAQGSPSLYSGSVDMDIVDADQEEENGVRICLPYNFRDSGVNANAIELNGEVVPLAGHENDDLLIYLKPDDFSKYEAFISSGDEN